MICVCGTKLCKLEMVSDILDHPVYIIWACFPGAVPLCLISFIISTVTVGFS